MKRTQTPTLRSQAHLQAHKALAQKPTCKRASLHSHTGNTLFFLLLVLLTVHTNAQPAIPRPVFKTFQAIYVGNSTNTQNSNGNPFQQQQTAFQQNFLPMGGTPADIMQQVNQNAIRVMGVSTPGQTAYNNQQQQLQEIEQDLKDDKYSLVFQRFQNYYSLFQQLNPDNFSVTEAVYLSEAPFYDTPQSFETFENKIKQKAGLVKQILKQEGLSTNNGSAINYAIQKLFSQNNIYQDNKTGKTYVVKKISYDFDDFYGEKDWSKMFVAKLLQTNSGQCHSLPLLYLCIAEQLHAKAYLSLAPNHSYIQFFDNKNNLRNFETTNGHIVSTSWLLQSDAISAMAYKNKTYLDTLTSKELFAECLADFENAYIAKNYYDAFTKQVTQQILAIDSTNVTALMNDANFEAYKYKDLHNKYGNPHVEQFNQYPELQQAYNNMKAAQQKVMETGYQDMPKEQYIEWKNSIDREQNINKSKKINTH